jgi:hypothetical protein
MERINEKNYEEVIAALQKFKTEIEEQCEIMRTAGEICVTIADYDDYAVKCNENLVKCLTKIVGTRETIDDVVAYVDLSKVTLTKNEEVFEVDVVIESTDTRVQYLSKTKKVKVRIMKK